MVSLGTSTLSPCPLQNLSLRFFDFSIGGGGGAEWVETINPGEEPKLFGFSKVGNRNILKGKSQNSVQESHKFQYVAVVVSSWQRLPGQMWVADLFSYLPARNRLPSCNAHILFSTREQNSEQRLLNEFIVWRSTDFGKEQLPGI